MNIELVKADATNESRLKEMFQIYVAEMQKFLDQGDERSRSVDAAEVLRKYQANQPNWPYLIFADGEAAGFCLLKLHPDEPETIDVDQYYVASEFRRQGVGARSLEKLIEYHRGRWIIRVLKTNPGALKFWRLAAEACVGAGNVHIGEMGHMHCLRFDTRVRTQ